MDQNPAQPSTPQPTDQSAQTPPQPQVPAPQQPDPASQPPAPAPEPAPAAPQPVPATEPAPVAPAPEPTQPQPVPAPQPEAPAPQPEPAQTAQPVPAPEPAPAVPQPVSPEPAPAAPQPAEQPAQPAPAPAASAPATENLQSTVSAPAKPAAEHHSGPSSKIFTIILVLIILAGLGYGGYLYAVSHFMQKSAPSTAQSNVTHVVKKVVPTATPTPDLTASWQLYSNAKYAYSIKYPAGLTPHEVNTPYSYVEFKNASSSGSLPPYMVTVIPATFTAKNLTAYNYMSSDWIDSLSSLKTGESATSSGTTFTRLVDMTVNGQNAVNVTVTATGTKQERVYVKANGNIYVLSNYYQSPSESVLQEFSLFVSSFKLKK